MNDRVDEAATASQPHHGALPWLAPSNLDASRRRVYDAITGGMRNNGKRAMPLTDKDGRLEGPFNAMLFSPAVGFALQALGGALRFNGVLSNRLRELAVLEVARIRHCTFEWLSHAPLAVAAGFSDEEVTTLRTAGVGTGFSSTEELVREVTRELLTRHDLQDEQIEAMKTALGVAGACELLILVGYYDLLATSLQVWRTPLPQGATPPDLAVKSNDEPG